MVEENLKEKAGARLKERRLQLSLTQQQVADALNITQPVYQRFEMGIFECSYTQLAELCRLLDVSADYLLGLKEY